MHNDTDVESRRSWMAVVACLGVFGLGLVGLLYNSVLLMTHVWWLWPLSSLAVAMLHTLSGPLSPWITALYLGGGGLGLTMCGLQASTSLSHATVSSGRQSS